MRARQTAQLNQMTQSMLLKAEQDRKRIEEATIEEFKWRGQYEKEKGYPPTDPEVIQWYNNNYPDLTELHIMAMGKMYEDTHPEEKK